MLKIWFVGHEGNPTAKVGGCRCYIMENKEGGILSGDAMVDNLCSMV